MMIRMHVPRCAAAASMLAAMLLSAPAPAQPADEPRESVAIPLTPAQKDAERAARRKLAADALQRLYKLHPEARKSLERAAGYAVFDISSIYVILFVGQKGTGILVENGSGKTTYMTSKRAGTGPGVGKQRVFQVFVFKTKDAMNQFLSTGETGVDVSASVSLGTGGMVRSFNPNVDIYQIPESGMAVQASWGGTVYSVDADLK